MKIRINAHFSLIILALFSVFKISYCDNVKLVAVYKFGRFYFKSSKFENYYLSFSKIKGFEARNDEKPNLITPFRLTRTKGSVSHKIEYKDLALALAENDNNKRNETSELVWVKNTKENENITKVWIILKRSQNNYKIRHKFTKKCIEINEDDKSVECKSNNLIYKRQNFEFISEANAFKTNIAPKKPPAKPSKPPTTTKKKYFYRTKTVKKTVYKMTKEEELILEAEPVDVFLKCIVLSDPNLHFHGVKMKSDFDNGELQYTLRSIIQNIPWVRRIYLVMPNEKLYYLKEDEETLFKFIYIKNTDLIIYDAGCCYPYKFNVWRMRKFGIAENIIVMDDDYIIGRPLKKSDFFYVKNGKVLPYIVNPNINYFGKIGVGAIYDKAVYQQDFLSLDPHCFGYDTIIARTRKLMIDFLNTKIFIPNSSHTAVPMNLRFTEEVYEIVLNHYEYRLYFLKSLHRSPFALQDLDMNPILMLNKYKARKNRIEFKYYEMKKYYKIPFLNMPKLYVFNNSGCREYSDFDLLMAKIYMEVLFHRPTKYEKAREEYKITPKLIEAIHKLKGLMRQYAVNIQLRDELLKICDRALEKLTNSNSEKPIKVLQNVLLSLRKPLEYLNLKTQDTKINKIKSQIKNMPPEKTEKFDAKLEPKVCVVIFVDKCYESLKKIYESLTLQTLENIEILIIGTNIHSQLLVSSINEQDKRISIINITNNVNNTPILSLKSVINNIKSKYVTVIDRNITLTKSILMYSYEKAESLDLEILQWHSIKGVKYDFRTFQNLLKNKEIKLLQPEIRHWMYYDPAEIRLFDNRIDGKFYKRETLAKALELAVTKYDTKNMKNYYLINYIFSQIINNFYNTDKMGSVEYFDRMLLFNKTYLNNREKNENNDRLIMLNGLLDIVPKVNKEDFGMKIIVKQVDYVVNNFEKLSRENKLKVNQFKTRIKNSGFISEEKKKMFKKLFESNVKINILGNKYTEI